MGVSRPSWMNDEEWSEYTMTEEYRYELTHEPDYDPYDDFGHEWDAFEVQEIECAECGTYMYLEDDVNDCDYCEATYNAWGQRLKPQAQWEDDYYDDY